MYAIIDKGGMYVARRVDINLRCSICSNEKICILVNYLFSTKKSGINLPEVALHPMYGTVLRGTGYCETCANRYNKTLGADDRSFLVCKTFHKHDNNDCVTCSNKYICATTSVDIVIAARKEKGYRSSRLKANSNGWTVGEVA